MSVVVLSLLSWIIASSGALAKPVITLTPNWATILPGDSVTMTCEEASVQPHGQEYSWYRDQQLLQRSKQFIIESAEEGQSGNYQCRSNEYSDPLRLDVRNVVLILQVPPSVHEGDDVSMRCHSSSGYRAGKTEFYYEKQQIQINESDTYSIRNINMSRAGTYQCKKHIYIDGYWRDDISPETSLSVKELFSSPAITVSPNDPIEGTDVTLTCNTDLSSFRPGTGLQFAFYRSGNMVRDFDSSNTYWIQSARTEDSGDFTCEVKTTNHRVKKKSDTRNIQVQELFSIRKVNVIPQETTEGAAITLTCDTTSSSYITQLLYAFYRDEETVQTFSSSNKYLIQSAKLEDSGNYTCQVRTPNNKVQKTSQVSSIQIQELFSIPKVNVIPQETTEGAAITLTCDTTSPFIRLLYAFYRDEETVQTFRSSNKYLIQSAKLEDSGNYTCQVQTPNNKVQKRSQVSSIQIQERISSPQIEVSPREMTEGAGMNLTCDTVAQNATDLLYAFYRNEEMVQAFSSSNKYLVLSTRREDSGNYTCEVRTSKYNVRKRSPVLPIRIQGPGAGAGAGQPYILPALITSVLILLVVAVLVFVFRRKLASICHKPSQCQQERDVGVYEEPVRSENLTLMPEQTHHENTEPADSELCYAKIKIHSKAEDSEVMVDNPIIYSEVKKTTLKQRPTESPESVYNNVSYK